VPFRQLWTTFLERQRHLDEGSASLYAGYGEHHLLPFFGDTDIALIQRTRPLRAADIVPGTLVRGGRLAEGDGGHAQAGQPGASAPRDAADLQVHQERPNRDLLGGLNKALVEPR
jgi:hypothetical protein